MQLGIDAKKSDQVVRGAVVMPNGTGKTKRVAVFAQGPKAEEAKAAGADIVGMDDLAARVKAGEMPFDVVIAAPDAMRVVGQLGQILGEFYYVSNRNYLAWGNVPFIQPYLQPATNAGQTFLEVGIFPLPSRQTPPPPDLFNQLGGRPNLVYYDWEITPQRLWNSRLLWDFFHILSRHLPQPENSPSKNWLMALLAELWKDPANPSQSVTEITQVSPTELRLIRKSHVGLTGFELASLSAWMDSPGFPLRYVPPKLMSEGRGTNAPGAKAAAPRPAAPGKR